jgi:hypothetical protein
MAWPKGVKRGPRTRQTMVERTPIRKTWIMKAGANWETATDDPEIPDRLHIPKDQIPEGMDLRWVMTAVRGQPMPQFEAGAKKRGWTPVHPQDFDGLYEGKFTPAGYEGAIEMEGLTLMARPLEMSLKARKRDYRNAREQVMIKEQALKSGADIAAMGADHPTAVANNRISRTYERLTVPQDE